MNKQVKSNAKSSNNQANDVTTPESVFNGEAQTSSSKNSNQSGSKASMWIATIGISALVGVGGFMAGMQVGSNGSTSTARGPGSGQMMPPGGTSSSSSTSTGNTPPTPPDGAQMPANNQSSNQTTNSSTSTSTSDSTN